MTYSARRRIAPIVWMLVALLALPPGVLTRWASAASRTETLSREVTIETFRNPQFSSGAVNKFLYANGPSAFVGGGGESFTNPLGRGYGGGGMPIPLWLTNDGLPEWAEADLRLPGIGLPLVLERTYRGSVSGYDGPMGKEWEFNWNRRLFEEEDDDVVFYDQGRKETYDESGGSYTSPVGRYDTLAKDTTPDPDIFTRTDKYGIQETYEDEGSGWYRLTEVEDLDGNTHTFAYDASSQLTKVTDTLAQDTTLSYDANGRITTISDHASRDWAYEYNANGYLTKAISPLTDTWTKYTYDGSDRLRGIERPEDGGSAALLVTFDGSGRVTKQDAGDGDFTLAYSTGSVTVTDRAGVDTVYDYDNDERITSRRVDPADDNWTTTYTYNSDHEVALVTFPNGNRLHHFYDSSGNLVTLQFQKDSGDTTSPVEWVYSYASNARLSTLKDPEGNTWDYDYDADGHLITRTAPAVTLPSGIATADKNGNGTYDGTIQESYDYHADGALTKVTDATGTVTEYEYTTVNSTPAYLHKIKRDTGVGNLNLVTQYDYDGKGYVTKVTDPESNETTYTVNNLGLVTQAVEPLSVTRKMSYDDNLRLTKTELSNDTDVGNSWYTVDYQYDDLGNRTMVIADETDSARLTTSYDFDAASRVTKVTSPDGEETTSTYDDRGLRTAVTREMTSNEPITTYTYDDNGNRTTVTDPEGNDTILAYDKLDRVTKVTTPVGHYTTTAYDDSGNVTKVSRYASGATKLAESTTSYDQANRVYQTERMAKEADGTTDIGDGQQTQTVHRDEAGRVLEYSDDVCGCSASTYVYDAVGRRITSKDPMPAAEQNLILTYYDDNGRVTKTVREEETQDTGIEADKDITTEMVYDARGRLVTRRALIAAATYADTLYFYGKRDQVTKVTSPESDDVLTEYDEQLRRTKVTQDNGAADVVTEWVYDDDGRVVTYRAKNATTGDQETLYTYDAIGRLVTTTWPDAGVHVYTYDKESRRISTTDPNGTVIENSYDDNGRLTAVDITQATNVVGITDIDYGYDGLGRMTSADAAEGMSYTANVERTYNSLGKIETETQVIDGYDSGNGRTITYDWNVAGQKTGVTYPVSGDVITYDRDDLDRVDKISRGSDEVVDYAFNGSRVIEKALPGSVAEMTYDLYGRLTTIHHKDTSSSNTLLQLDYGYDDAHRVTHFDTLFYDDVENTRIADETEDEGSQYAYDGAGRLVTALRGVPTAKIGTAIATNITNDDYDDLVEYEYDPTGNRVTRDIDGSTDTTYEHNKVNEMTKEDTSTLTYDANGNFTGTSNTYKYTFTNQIGQRTSPVTFTWHYDALGRSVERVRSNLSSRSYYDGIHKVEKASWDSSTSTETGTAVFVYGDRVDELLAYIDTSADPDDEYYAHADRLGSIMLLVDDTGAIQESYRYREFGTHTILDDSFTRLTQGAASPVGNPYRYTGRPHARVLEGSGETWYDYRARHYRADAGRFVQRDPAGYLDGANLYQYVRSSPLNHTDPLGLYCEGGSVSFNDPNIAWAAASGEWKGFLGFGTDTNGFVPLTPKGSTTRQGLCEVDVVQICCGSTENCSTFDVSPGEKCTASCGTDGLTPTLVCCKQVQSSGGVPGSVGIDTPPPTQEPKYFEECLPKEGTPNQGPLGTGNG